jgi:hypothetical protein
MLVATLGGPTMFARIGVMRALNRSRAGVRPVAQKRSIGDGRRRHALPKYWRRD